MRRHDRCRQRRRAGRGLSLEVSPRRWFYAGSGGVGGTMKVGLRNRSLLIVDDNVHMQRTLRDLATGIGYDAATVSSLREATDAVSRRRFDVALVDKRLVEHDSRND